MAEYLKFEKSNCMHCYKCIRHCPVKSISFSNEQANVLSEECVLCGQCLVVCPQNAKHVRDDLKSAKHLVQAHTVYASVAPSFAANYDGASFEALRAALQKLGFAGAEETAIGATMVKNRYIEIMQNEEQQVIISSCCPSVNMLIQKHHPEALPLIAKVLSPMQAHCRDIKERHEGAKTIFIGPCISKKAEAEQYAGDVDCVLTFEELSRWMKDCSVPIEHTPAVETGRARLFPIAGGILQTMGAPVGNYRYLCVDGIQNCVQAIKEAAQGSIGPCFIEMSACTGSCVGGPAIEPDKHNLLKNTLITQQSAARQDYAAKKATAQALKKPIEYYSIKHQYPGKGAIEEVLKRIGKTKPEDELNCSSCGYETCREKAAAVLMGKAELSMCLPYLMEKAQSFSDHIIKNMPNGIIVLNEKLQIQQLNSAAKEILNLRSKDEVLGRDVICVLDPSLFVEALEAGKPITERKVYLAEYQKYVRYTVIYDANFHILITIMRDVTQAERSQARKEEVANQTIALTDKVIEKQMRAVQEIASLLGETTAETEIALTRLKETLRHE
ncbi:MAG: [Fe-Fe] hydrogenase large subunit C-terminal domain-containing protein [Christensenellales bacterium]|jgi:iron only hydrogenase large subunit-like protein/uncharacterized Fe-S cluster-containing protein